MGTWSCAGVKALDVAFAEPSTNNGIQQRVNNLLLRPTALFKRKLAEMCTGDIPGPPKNARKDDLSGNDLRQHPSVIVPDHPVSSSVDPVLAPYNEPSDVELEELQLAIALSLQPSNRGGSSKRMSDPSPFEEAFFAPDAESSDNEGEQMKMAMALSLEPAN
ncbi:hypothetical protein OCU04_003387 [Sclerotinia nivalis]|uniref:Uncharacterized protein n=1 Tax=Sclerotinia nivalis TaxID=352851 RepID=A0A9X0ART7_9HELO|nr:hypothetical protein OCU04_003387 [Sclerotinia nivalis]